MQSGENVQALHRILDLTRFISIVLLLLHFYSVCYPAIKTWGLTFSFLDSLVFNLTQNLPFLDGVNKPKLASLILLIVSLIGGKGKKNDKLTYIMSNRKAMLFQIMFKTCCFLNQNKLEASTQQETTKKRPVRKSSCQKAQSHSIE